MLPKKERISRTLFSGLLKERNFRNSEHFTLRFSIQASTTSRFGVSVSKKIAKSAVTRNTIRRRVYVSLTSFLSNLSPGLFLIVAKAGAQKIKGEALARELETLFSEARLFVQDSKRSYNP